MQPDEALTAIEIPELPLHTGMAFLKSGRVTQDIAVANVAVCVQMKDGVCKKCRVAAGAVGPVPMRLHGVESFVEGKEITRDLLLEIQGKAAGEVTPITDVRSTEIYRRTVTGVMVKRALERAFKQAEQASSQDHAVSGTEPKKVASPELTAGLYDSPLRKLVRFNQGGEIAGGPRGHYRL